MEKQPNQEDLRAYIELMRGLPVVYEDTTPEEDMQWDQIASLQELLNKIESNEKAEDQ